MALGKCIGGIGIELGYWACLVGGDWEETLAGMLAVGAWQEYLSWGHLQLVMDHSCSALRCSEPWLQKAGMWLALSLKQGPGD